MADDWFELLTILAAESDVVCTLSTGAVSGSRDFARSTDYRSAYRYIAHCVAHRLTTLLNCKILKYGEIICER